jgi:hypothetical protein
MSYAKDTQKLVLSFAKKWVWRLLIFLLHFKKEMIGWMLASRKFCSLIQFLLLIKEKKRKEKNICISSFCQYHQVPQVYCCIYNWIIHHYILFLGSHFPHIPCVYFSQRPLGQMALLGKYRVVVYVLGPSPACEVLTYIYMYTYIIYTKKEEDFYAIIPEELLAADACKKKKKQIK